MKKYLTKFSTRAEYTAALENLDFPNVTYLSEDDEMVFSQVKPEPETDWSKEYLTFLALDDCTFANERGMEYSLDGGETWEQLFMGDNTPTVMAGNKIMFKATETGGGIKFSSTGKYEAMGNAYSMLFGDDFAEVRDLSEYGSVLGGAFRDNTNLISAKNLSLPAATLAESCYESMFNGCTSLTTAPELPAATLASYCYGNMFEGCTSLTEAPALPAATLASYCYDSMFNGCTSLTTAPALPVTTLAEGCYGSMFNGCTSLTTAPELPATTLAEFCYASMFSECTSLTAAPALPAATLANQCYASMFSNCTSLTAAPALPAATLAESCYFSMFYNCTSLTEAPALPATTLAESCYSSMFNGCTSLTTAPALPAATLASSCYNAMFSSCTSLNYIKMLATDVSATNCLDDWVTNVAQSGTFVKNASMSSLPSGTSGIPAGWTVETATA